MAHRRTLVQLLKRPAVWSIGFSTVVIIVNAVRGDIPPGWAALAIVAGLAGTAMVVGFARASNSRLRWIDWAAVAGLFLGLMIGDSILGIPWNNGGQPVPLDARRLIGPGVGAVAGAVLGAMVSRVLVSRTAAER